MNYQHWGRLMQCLAFSLAFCSGAWAEIPGGVFKGTTATVVTKSVTGSDGAVTHYGLVMPGDGTQAGLYRIEELEDRTQAWVAIYQSNQHLLAVAPTQDASFGVQALPSGNKGATLKFTPTEFGKQNGCLSAFDAKSTGDGDEWAALPATGSSFLGKKGDKLEIRQSLLTGSFKIGETVYQPMFSLTEFFPGLQIVRAQTLHPETVDGRYLEKNITALAAVMKVRNKLKLQMIELRAGSHTCFAPATSLDQN
jgi:hypothetical protein